MSTTVPAIRRSVVVATTPAHAYALWRNNIGAWWPLAKLSVFGEGSTVSFEGDDIVERGQDGSSSLWGTVMKATPGSTLTFTWRPGKEPENATEVTVNFVAITVHGRNGSSEGTLVELEHSGWEALADPQAASEEYGHGWPIVFDSFAAASQEPEGADEAEPHAWLVLRHTAAPGSGNVFEHPLFREHAAFLDRCVDAGVLVAAGPLSIGEQPGGEGMTVLRVPADQREHYINAAHTEDRSVADGLFTVEIIPWRVVMSAVIE